MLILLVKNFLFDKLDHFLISKNLHALKTIHSIYNAISKKKSYFKRWQYELRSHFMNVFSRNNL